MSALVTEQKREREREHKREREREGKTERERWINIKISKKNMG